MFKEIKLDRRTKGKGKKKWVGCHYCGKDAKVFCEREIPGYGKCLRACCEVHGKGGICLGHRSN